LIYPPLVPNKMQEYPKTYQKTYHTHNMMSLIILDHPSSSSYTSQAFNLLLP
jgi:hypothetical protein